MVFSCPRRDKAHVNIAEARGHLQLLLRRARDPARVGTRVVYLLDSGACVGALARGRSPSRLLNSVRDFYAWCASDEDPFDEPSRRYQGHRVEPVYPPERPKSAGPMNSQKTKTTDPQALATAEPSPGGCSRPASAEERGPSPLSEAEPEKDRLPLEQKCSFSSDEECVPIDGGMPTASVVSVGERRR